MAKNFTQNEIVINGQKQTIEQVANSISKLSGSQIADFFLNRDIKLPRAVRMSALRSVLNAKIVKSHDLNLSDEQRYRLLYYPYFSETQLENFFKVMSDEESFAQYKFNLVSIILAGLKQLKISEIELSQLFNTAPTNEVETFEEFEKNLFPAVYDNPNEFEGISHEQFREILAKSSTLVELREIGDKYDLNIPRRLKREELQDVIVSELKDRDLYSIEVEEQLSKMSVLNLQRFAKDRGIKASVELKKEELIEFVLKFFVKAEIQIAIKSVPAIYVPELMDFTFDPMMVKNMKMCRDNVVAEVNYHNFVKPVTEETHTVEETIHEPIVEEQTQVEEINFEEIIQEPIVEEVKIEEIIQEPIVEEVKVEEEVNIEQLLEEIYQEDQVVEQEDIIVVQENIEIVEEEIFVEKQVEEVITEELEFEDVTEEEALVAQMQEEAKDTSKPDSIYNPHYNIKVAAATTVRNVFVSKPEVEEETKVENQVSGIANTSEVFEETIDNEETALSKKDIKRAAKLEKKNKKNEINIIEEELEEVELEDEFFEQYFKPKFVDTSSTSTPNSRSRFLATSEVKLIQEAEKNAARMNKLQKAREAEKEYFERIAAKTALLQAKELREKEKNRKSRKRAKAFKLILLLVVIIAILVLLVPILNTAFNGTNEIILQAYNFLDKYISPVMSFGNTVGKYIKDFVDSIKNMLRK